MGKIILPLNKNVRSGQEHFKTKNRPTKPSDSEEQQQSKPICAQVQKNFAQKKKNLHKKKKVAAQKK